MKAVNIYLEEKEHEKLSKDKGARTWKWCLLHGVHQVKTNNEYVEGVRTGIPPDSK